jgi:uncharacterized protein
MSTEVTVPSNDDKNIAVITHLAGICLSIIPGLVVWLLKKDENAYLSTQAKEALNFQITMLLIFFICKVLMWVLIGFALLPLAWVLDLVLCIFAAVATSKGEQYKYPFTLRLIS